jgi:hypothetical protein
MSSINAEDYFNLFLQKIRASKTVKQLWNDLVANWKYTAWTAAMTKVLTETTKAMSPNLHVAAKDNHDGYDRAEYFNLDVTAYDDSRWGPPQLIVEHEHRPDKLQYSAWKLLCVDARLRILVAYFGSIDPPRLASKAELISVVRPVIEEFPEKALTVIIGNWESNKGAQNDWSRVFSLIPDIRSWPGAN